MLRLFIFIFGMSLCPLTTHAATTVFADTVYAQAGVVTNSAGGLGAPDGGTAVVGGTVFFGLVGTAGEVTYSFSAPVTGADVTLSAADSPLTSTIALAIGEIVSGTAVFSTEVTFVENTGGNFTFDLSSQCSAISLTGCSLLRIRNAGGFLQGTFALDGVSGVAATPEPRTWAFMILGFVMVASRLKASRRENQYEVDELAFGKIVAPR